MITLSSEARFPLSRPTRAKDDHNARSFLTPKLPETENRNGRNLRNSACVCSFLFVREGFVSPLVFVAPFPPARSSLRRRRAYVRPSVVAPAAVRTRKVGGGGGLARHSRSTSISSPCPLLAATMSGVMPEIPPPHPTPLAHPVPHTPPHIPRLARPNSHGYTPEAQVIRRAWRCYCTY